MPLPVRLTGRAAAAPGAIECAWRSTAASRTPGRLRLPRRCADGRAKIDTTPTMTKLLSEVSRQWNVIGAARIRAQAR